MKNSLSKDKVKTDWGILASGFYMYHIHVYSHLHAHAHTHHICILPTYSSHTCARHMHALTHTCHIHILPTYASHTCARHLHALTHTHHILPTYTSHTWTQAPTCTCAYIAHKYTHTHILLWNLEDTTCSGHPYSTNQLKQPNIKWKANVATLGSGTKRASDLPCLCSRSWNETDSWIEG